MSRKQPSRLKDAEKYSVPPFYFFVLIMSAIDIPNDSSDCILYSSLVDPQGRNWHFYGSLRKTRLEVD